MNPLQNKWESNQTLVLCRNRSGHHNTGLKMWRHVLSNFRF